MQIRKLVRVHTLQMYSPSRMGHRSLCGQRTYGTAWQAHPDQTRTVFTKALHYGTRFREIPNMRTSLVPKLHPLQLP